MEQLTIRNLVRKALEEDLAWGDITSSIMVPEDDMIGARLLCKSECVLCGEYPFTMAFEEVDPLIQCDFHIKEGTLIKPGETAARIFGPTKGMLMAERVALNFLNHMSGIATQTRAVVESIEGTACRVTDTRKTLPLLREIQRHAVRVGGGTNHRMDLSSLVLIKDNHIRAVGSVSKAVLLAKSKVSHVMKVEVEVTCASEAKEAFDAGADIVMLDNMTPDQIKEIVRMKPPHVILEASGKITPQNARDYAESGVDVISMGFLTHSVKSADFSLEFD